MSEFNSPFYKRCNDPECPQAYAYKSTTQEGEHFHYIGGTVADPIPGYEGDDNIRRYALTTMQMHDPRLQGHGYDRCEYCHYTRHPCDVYELAALVLALMDRGRTDA